MTAHWEAPRIAYELAADWAERYEQGLAGRHGGEDGQPPLFIEMGKAWHDLHRHQQREVMEALSAQLRSVMYTLTCFLPCPVVIDEDNYMFHMCDKARDTLAALSSSGGPEDGWEMPSCLHCAGLIAQALIHTQVSALKMMGIADPAAVLRISASYCVPAPRMAGAGD